MEVSPYTGRVMARLVRPPYISPSVQALWSRWKRLAHRAADAQGQALFFLLYFVVLVPVAAVRRAAAVARRSPRHGPPAPPAWHSRQDAPVDLPSARRQF
jgi:hypothetical protein